MSRERKEMETSNPNNSDVKVLKDIIAKALNGGPPTQRLPSDMQSLSPTATNIEGRVHGNCSASAGGSELEAPAQSKDALFPPQVRIRAIREPFGPPASGHRGFTRILPRATSANLAKAQPWPDDQAEPSTLYQSTLSIVPLHIQDRVTTTISTIYGSAALSWRHGKSASEPILPTRPGVKGVKKVFENLFRRIAAKCEEVSSSTEAFKPSRMLLEQRGLRDNKSAVRIPGHPYMGDMSSNSFLAQIPDLEDNENCALWLQNVPVGVIEADFFKVINTDGVWCLHINSANEVHPEQAAKLVFMTPGGARALKELADKNRFFIGGKPIKARYNRNGYMRQQKKASRVLYIEGPSWYMTEEHWAAFFKDVCVCTIEYIGVLHDDERIKKMEFRFCRVDGQAETCLQAITKDKNLPCTVQACYGLDPCDPNNANKSHQDVCKDWRSTQKPKFDPRNPTWRR